MGSLRKTFHLVLDEWEKLPPDRRRSVLDVGGCGAKPPFGFGAGLQPGVERSP